MKASRWTLFAGTCLLTLVVVLLCLIPKRENDLFFILRIGRDILQTGHLPQFDTYSWTQHGTRWAVPEWGAFVLYALAYRAGAFFGVWLLMTVLAVLMAWLVWFYLARRVGLAWAFLLTNLMLLALGVSDCLQERPYAFTYLLLPAALIVVQKARAGRPRLLLWLVPLCVLWANLHQGVLAFIGLLLCYALGDRVAGRKQAWQMTATAAACAGAVLLTPYGWRIYWNVWITLRDPALMANVTEWKPITVLHPAQLEPFFLLTLLAFSALFASRRRTLADGLALFALWGEALLHARNTTLFALGGLIIAAPHFRACLQQMRGRGRTRGKSALQQSLIVTFTVLYVFAIALVSVVRLRGAVGPLGYSLEGIGQAAAEEPSYPKNACAFVVAEGFPADLRLLNNFEIGGYLLWHLPQEPVFVDGRLDVYTGHTFNAMLALSRTPGTPAWKDLINHYDFDCVLTTSRKQSEAFAALPDWQLVYADPINPRKQRCRILLRCRPRFASLIARCLRDRPLPKETF